MSVKIYNGYKTNLKMEEIYKICKEYKHIISKAKDNFIKSSKSYIDRRLIDSKNRKEFKDLFSEHLIFDMVFFPINDYILVLPFYTDYIYEKIGNQLINDLKLSKYGYWDNVDPDESCTDEEWEQRERDWEEVLIKYDGIPRNNGLVFNLENDYINAISLYMKE